MAINPEPLLAQVVSIARDAAAAILAIYDTNFSVAQKDDKSPLTAADMAANRVITEGLKNITPTVPVLSEESASVPFAERRKWYQYWLVDPLDGTREFVKRNGEFTVNIALINDQSPVLGVIWVPVTGVCYFACRGHGAFKQEHGGEPQRIHVRPRPSDNTVVAGSRSHADKSLDGFMTKIGAHELVSMGSSLKSCLVAEGKADIYPRLGPTSEWDTGAAQSIVEEAGGHMTNLQLEPIRYNSKESVLNPSFLVYGDATVDWKSYL